MSQTDIQSPFACAIFRYDMNGVYFSSSTVYWEHMGSDLGGSKFSPLSDINKGNLASLREEWTFHFGYNPFGSNFTKNFRHQCTPLMVDDGTESGIYVFTKLS